MKTGRRAQSEITERALHEDDDTEECLRNTTGLIALAIVERQHAVRSEGVERTRQQR